MNATRGDVSGMLSDAAHKTIEELARAFNEVTEQSVEVKAEAELAFLAAYGWWAKITRTCRAVSLLDKEGLAIESEPLVRVVTEHTLALQWLIDGSPDTLDALEEEGRDQRKNLIESAAKAEWKLPAGVTPPELPSRGDEHPLRAEFSNFLTLTQLYGEESTYVAYRLMSSEVHPSEKSSKAHLHQDPNGRVSIRGVPDGDTSAPITHAALCLIQAAKMMDPLFVSSPLGSAIARAQLLFGSEVSIPQRLPAKDIPARSVPDRIAVTASEFSKAKAISAIVFEAMRKSDAVRLGQVNESQRKRRVMVDVEILANVDTGAPAAADESTSAGS
ncbi:DUF5677 domain-containing protein [Streptomyces mirabilis]|uniref:DUF5677 domain-containing protein n=1 Tax=Streptomyces mirabilis TaxID=68239 RepID=UPI00343E24CC